MSKKKRAAAAGHSSAEEASAKRSKREAPELAAGPAVEEHILTISKAIADPRRLVILRTISEGPATCTSLKDCLGISGATLSHHVHELEAAGLIQTSRDGRLLKLKLQRKVWKNYLAEMKAMLKI